MKSPNLHRSLLVAAAFAGLATFASAETVVTTTESAGTISDFSPDALVIRSESTTAPTRYVLSRDVSYVDDTGVPVSMEVVRSGAPVTVHYTRDGDRVLARRVVVHRRTTAPAAVVETVRPTTTVVERPVAVERPVVVEKPVVVERERPVVVEKRPALIEERTTTTTTTTNSKKDRD